MAIEERIIKQKSGPDQWEIKATGKDVNELKGHLKEAADACNERNERENRHYGMVELEDSKGRRDVYRQDKALRMQRKGYFTTRKSFIVPDLPWLNKKED